MPLPERLPFDLPGLVERTKVGPCFICGMLSGDPAFRHHVIVEDDAHIAFLSKYPTLPGYSLVCPRAHVEDLAFGLDPTDYLALQTMVHRLSRALSKVFSAERVYVLSLGSAQGNSHLHWHVVPLPAGIPYEKQQYHALMAEHGVLAQSEAVMATQAHDIAAAYAAGY